MLRFCCLFVLAFNLISCASRPQSPNIEETFNTADAEERLKMDELFLKKSQNLGAARLRNSSESAPKKL